MLYYLFGHITYWLFGCCFHWWGKWEISPQSFGGLQRRQCKRCDKWIEICVRK